MRHLHVFCFIDFEGKIHYITSLPILHNKPLHVIQTPARVITVVVLQFIHVIGDPGPGILYTLR